MRGVDKVTMDCVKLLTKLEPQEFIGVCKILGVELLEEQVVEEKSKTDLEVEFRVRGAEILLQDAIDKIGQLNKTQARNLRKLLKAATKGVK